MPNYLLGEFTAAEYVAEMPTLGTLSNPFDPTSAFHGLATMAGVDVVRPRGQVTLEQILTTLNSTGYTYDHIDALFCRGTLSSQTPQFIKTSANTLFKGVGTGSFFHALNK